MDVSKAGKWVKNRAKDGAKGEQRRRERENQLIAVSERQNDVTCGSDSCFCPRPVPHHLSSTRGPFLRLDRIAGRSVLTLRNAAHDLSPLADHDVVRKVEWHESRTL